MKRLVVLLAFLASSAIADLPPGQAVFSYVDYAGTDPVAAALALGPGQYRNPVIPGFHPDPSIVRVGQDYYLVNSSFAFFPGLPVFHSRDLVNWQQIGNAIDRPGMFDFTGLGVARAIFAPTIRQHSGQFYIANTCIECGFNFIITARNPAGPWSDPVFLPPVDGIDPDLFFDDDGRAWIANNGPPAGDPHYDGHRALWIQELDLRTLKMTGPRQIIVNGGVRIADKPIWTEGPHMFKRDGWYYLIAAEGGTAGNHSETVFRSRRVTGPYGPGPINPILTQRDLDPARRFPVQATGHADFVRTSKGQWWAVFLGTRPYAANLSNMGRETFLLPVQWQKHGWPLILPAKTAVPQVAAGPEQRGNSGAWRDEFSAPKLDAAWLMLRTPKERWFSLTTHPDALTLTARAISLGSKANPGFLAIRQRHHDALVETELRFLPGRIGDRAGLAIFADEQHHFFFGLQQAASGPQLIVARRNGPDDPEEGRILAQTPMTTDKPLRLRLAARGAAVDFSFAGLNGQWQLLLKGADGSILASEATNQFTGTVIGPYASAGH
jgi:xylan 1,4-beta-xylosidase